ncbi:ABC transporter permease [Micromonospora tulbaghiae]|uniref:ABC transporter permease n=1 Tax=Micromonospora tulbaghiae TaxID=479978 RepID=A0A386WNW6_9ACTN|nr:ABC transporter permease subunit [Micromonospora tulbaghiae]AYF30047.1 ABC transporter permease [Micromonospora tulbaghiae]
MSNLLTKTLWDGRRALAGFTAGTALLAAMYAGFYPQVADGAMGQTVQGFSPALREALRMEDLSSAAGYLGSSVFGIIVPLVAVIFGITTGTRAIAGDEEAGYLGLFLAHPISRTRLLLHRFAALTAGAIPIAAVVLLAMLAVRPGAQLDSITVGQFTAQSLALALLIIVFGTIAITVGAATGSRPAALAAAAGIAVLTYAASTLATHIGADVLRYVSPFHYYIGGEPLRNGFQWADLTILTATTAVLLTVAVAAFNRRDLTS